MNQTKVKSSKKPGPKKTLKKPVREVHLDHPGKGESVRPGHYAIRVGADGAEEVQIVIDAGSWVHCRPAVGYFWCDWWAVPGEHRVAVRARWGRLWKRSPLRACRVLEV